MCEKFYTLSRIFFFARSTNCLLDGEAYSSPRECALPGAQIKSPLKRAGFCIYKIVLNDFI